MILELKVSASCSGEGLWVFPSGQTIMQNSIFILDGYAESQNVVLGLNKQHNIYLKSGRKKIKLLVTEICVGQFYLTQAVLKPETELEAGLEYTLCIDSLPEYEMLNKYNETTKKNESVTYKVVREKDLEKPKLSSRPEELRKKLVYYGCGTSIHVIFSNPAEDKSDIIVKTIVKNLMTGIETTYYIKPDGEFIKVGHGMCSGAFDFDENNNYEVKFLFMDASGNITSWIGPPIQFSKPIKATTFDAD